MDIWELAFKRIANCSESSFFRKCPKVLQLNKELNGVHYESASAFINKYLKEYDLAHLYALNIACFDVIEISVELIDKAEEGSSLEFEDIVKENLNPFPEVQSLIDKNVLIQELYEVAEGKHYSNERLSTPANMLALGQLSYELQKTIENGPWKMDEKAHAYMCSLTIGNYNYFDYESFVYQLSRNIDCEDNIDNFIPYLQGGAKGRPSIYNTQHWHEAEVLRLIHWAEIGNISESVKMFCENISIKYPTKHVFSGDRGKDVYSFMSAYIRSLFPLLRSDLALDCLNDKLKKYIYACQGVLQDDFKLIKTIVIPEVSHQAKLSYSACYVFGAYRLGIDQFDINLINDSTAYLQKHQLPDASFLPSEYQPFFNCQVSSMIIHALWISEAFGWKRSIRRALKQLKKNQDSYGVWYDEIFDYTGYMTGLILDSFELAKDNPVITFKIPDHKKKSEQIAPSVNLSKLHEIANHIEIGTIQNIFGNTLHSSKTKSIEKSRLKTTVNKQPARTPVKPWRTVGDAAFLITDEGRIEFHFNGEKKDLRLGHKSRAYKLLYLLSGDKGLSSAFIKDKLCSENTKPYHHVRDVNRAILKRIKAAKFVGIPKDVAIIVHDEKSDSYFSLIPISSIDDYDRQYIRNETRLPEGDDEDDDYSDHYNEVDNR